MSAGGGRVRAAPADRFRRGLCSAVLVFEALVVVFAVLVAKDLSSVPTSRVVAVGLGGAVACLVVAGLLRRRWAYVVGSLLQVALILTGLVVPIMWVLGTVFAVLWASVFAVAHRIAQLTSAAAPPPR